jgi:hypothetical protein
MFIVLINYFYVKVILIMNIEFENLILIAARVFPDYSKVAY